MSHYLVIAGGRSFDRKQDVHDVLWFLHCLHGDDLRVLHGGARGADKLAQEVCDELGIRSKAYEADWKKDGQAAGHIRNAKMADLVVSWRKLGHSCQLVAFPGSNGTRNMVNQAEKRQIHCDLMP